MVGYIEIAKSPVAMAHDETSLPSPPVDAAGARRPGPHASAPDPSGPQDGAATDLPADQARSAQD